MEKKIALALAIVAALAVTGYAAVNLTINGVRTSQVVISIEYNEAGLATGAQISAQGVKLDSTGAVVSSIEKAWNYATLPAGLKNNIRGLVQSATQSMSQEVGESAAVTLP